MNKVLQGVKLKINELSTIVGFFKQKSIKIGIDEMLVEVNKYCINLNNELEILKNNYNALDNDTKKTINLYKNEISTLEEELEKIDFKYNKLHEEYEEHKNNTKALAIRNKLVTTLLSASSKNEALSKYKNLLKNDFLKFANEESSLSNEAEAIFMLQSIQEELGLISVYPNLFKKTVLSIGGGFSAGKSRFVNSFLDNKEISLPEGINPTTAIPTYVLHNESNHFVGCNNQGGIVDLYSIDENFHSNLSHDFIKSFEFNLKNIMPFMIIGTSIEKYKNICFIDTPGYNPATLDGSYTEEDKYTAREYIANSDALLWLIGLDANGTLSSDDIDFLLDLDFDNKELFIVINKADRVPLGALEEVLEHVEQTLNDYDIKYSGLTAYSSVTNTEYLYKKQSLLDFLKNFNKESVIQEGLINKLFKVRNMYKEAILKDIKENEAILRELSSLSTGLLKDGFDDLSSPLYQRINNLKNVFNIKKLEDDLRKLDIEINKLKEAIDDLFDKVSDIVLKKISKDSIKINYDFEIKDYSTFDDDIQEPIIKKKEKIKNIPKNNENNENNENDINELDKMSSWWFKKRG